MNRTRLRAALAAGMCAGLAAGAATPASAGDLTPFVIDGKRADAGEYPSMVFLEIADPAKPDEVGRCGATLIDPEWVLTAAHCTDPGVEITALLGAIDLEGDVGMAVDVVEIVDHPDYVGDTDQSNLVHDIALLRLAKPVDGPTMRLVQPGEEDLWAPDVTATLTGWGGTSSDETNQDLPNLLQEVDMPIVADAACKAEIERIEHVYDEAAQFCAGAPEPAPAEGPDACRGDSGGPLMVRDEENDEWVQVGAVSFGDTCGNTISAYTRLVSYLDWIDETTGGLPEPEPQPEPEPEPQPEPVSFSDIAGNVHEQRILAIAEEGITTGYTDGTYRPGVVVTRGQMAAFLARTLALPAGDPNRFPDSASSVHATWIAAVADAGIAGGFGDGSYRADAPVTRGQMATFLARAATLPQGPLGSFSDVSGDVHERAIGAVKAAGIATGSGDGTYQPSKPVTRDQMATFLYRAFLQQ